MSSAAADIVRQFEHLEHTVSRTAWRSCAFTCGAIALVALVIVVTWATFLFLGKAEASAILATLFLLMVCGGVAFIVFDHTTKCVTSLSVAKLYVGSDSERFLDALSGISCGGTAVRDFLTFVDQMAGGAEALRGGLSA